MVQHYELLFIEAGVESRKPIFIYVNAYVQDVSTCINNTRKLAQTPELYKNNGLSQMSHGVGLGKEKLYALQVNLLKEMQVCADIYYYLEIKM